MPGSPDATLVALIVSQPRMVGELAEKHVDDGKGRCRSCSAGAKKGHYPYPCLIRLAVDEARRQLDAQTPRRGPVPCDAARREEPGR